MSIYENFRFLEKIEAKIQKEVPVELGLNKGNELVRLIFEICRRDDISPEELFNAIGIETLAEERGKFFARIKEKLMETRFPSAGSGGYAVRLLPVAIKESDKERAAWSGKFYPANIFVENSVSTLGWTKKFISNFSDAKITEIENLKDFVRNVGRDGDAGKDEAGRFNARRDNVFIIRNKDRFIKDCPCTKGYKSCGYKILNLGFGCPIDCSYCFLQFYSNAPGIILPANIEDCLDEISSFDGKVDGHVRIGTGEFADSLALDRFTSYASELIPHFAELKNLVLELKTKTADIATVLEEEPNDNVVISWSVNTENIASRYEKGSAPNDERIRSAVKAAEKGYKVGFHFDPIVFYGSWEKEYADTVEKIFSHDILKKNTQWVSLGTLRYMPVLKQIAERRFADNRLFYDGEFFEDTDGKMRYSGGLRNEIYRKMYRWIKKTGTKAWVYLCMEPPDMWREVIARP